MSVSRAQGKEFGHKIMQFPRRVDITPNYHLTKCHYDKYKLAKYLYAKCYWPKAIVTNSIMPNVIAPNA